MLATVRVVRQQQDARARCQHEQHADQRLLLLRHAVFGPGEQRGAEQRGTDRRRLHHQPLRAEPHGVGRDHAQARDLRDRQIDEHDAAVEHLPAQRHVRGQHQQPGEERQTEDREVERGGVHWVAASSRSSVSSNSENRSFARSLPPTVNGSLTTGTPAFCCSQFDGRGSW